MKLDEYATNVDPDEVAHNKPCGSTLFGLYSLYFHYDIPQGKHLLKILQTFILLSIYIAIQGQLSAVIGLRFEQVDANIINADQCLHYLFRYTCLRNISLLVLDTCSELSAWSARQLLACKSELSVC